MWAENGLDCAAADGSAGESFVLKVHNSVETAMHSLIEVRRSKRSCLERQFAALG